MFNKHTRLESLGLDVLMPDMINRDLPMLKLVIIVLIVVFVHIGLCAILGVLWKLVALKTVDQA